VGRLDRKRNPPSWKYPTILAAVLEAYKTGAVPGSTYAQFP
jgi:hypothetical protein